MHSILKATLAIVIATGVAAASLPGFAQTIETFPSKPVRLVTSGAGGTNDIVARMIGQKMAEGWGQPVVVENRTGAGGAMAAATVARAAPDGYTLLLHSAQFVIGAAVHANLPYEPLKDFAGVTQIGFATNALVVVPSLGVKSVKDLIALAQAQPGKIIYSSSGAGSGTHMLGERFRLTAGIKVVHVGFKGVSDAMIEVLAGRVHYSMPPLGTALPFMRDGKLLALAVANLQRSPLLPDVPTMVEVLPGYERDGSFGLQAPARTPRPILNRIGNDVRRILDLPDIKERLQAMSFFPAPTTPEEFDKIVRADIATFTRVAKLVGLRAQ